MSSISLLVLVFVENFLVFMIGFPEKVLKLLEML